jgi:hypothetical protein
MSDRFTRLAFHSLLAPALFTAVFLLLAPVTNAQEATSPRTRNTRAAASRNRAEVEPKAEIVKPVYSEYKGINIGMSADEVRKKLGEPKDKSDDQDFFVFSDTESAQVFYQKGLVYAISINYSGASVAPKCKDVIGEEIQAKADGSMHQLVRYKNAGYWVSYSRTSGDSPLITVTIQKMP